MKTASKFPMIAFKDSEFMAKTTLELQEAKKAQQELLNIWNGLDLPPLHTTLFELVHAPQKVYTEAINQGVEEPASYGKYSIAPGVKLNITSAPVPDSILKASNVARSLSQVGRPELWSISPDGKTVLLNEAPAKELIESQNIIVENEQQKKLVEEVVLYVKLSNSVNEQLKGIQTMRMPAVPFTLTERSFPLIAGLELQTGQLREIIQCL